MREAWKEKHDPAKDAAAIRLAHRTADSAEFDKLIEDSAKLSSELLHNLAQLPSSPSISPPLLSAEEREEQALIQDVDSDQVFRLIRTMRPIVDLDRPNSQIASDNPTSS
ncbi:hypothetical protein EON65_54010, partial [archaeon]